MNIERRGGGGEGEAKAPPHAWLSGDFESNHHSIKAVQFLPKKPGKKVGTEDERNGNPRKSDSDTGKR